jgi:ornithine cyclodeaminase/alanine dehydrogenase-like protein (mu-crystallin family)
MTPDDGLRYLTRAEVVRAAGELDPVAVVRDALVLHASGRTTLPDEAYLGWETTDGRSARGLALPGALWGPEPALGVKLINSSLANPDRGLPRAQGLTVVFDRETAYPVALMEAAYLSALRTSAYSVLSVRLLGPPDPTKVAVVGCGALGEAHVRLLAAELPGAWFALYDASMPRAEALAAALRAEGTDCRPVPTAEFAVRGAGIVVTTTTTTTGYIPYDWLAPGALIAHVSLDDVLPDVVRRADLVVVDDWPLVRADDRRLLGRMYRTGDLVGPGEAAPGRVGPGGAGSGQAGPGGAPHRVRAVDAALADVVAGRHPGRTSADQIVLSNPFGMGILDVAFAAEVLRVARREGLGTVLAR